MEYIAFKISGLNHWIWFKKENVTRENGNIKAVNGWGKRGELTTLKTIEREVVGEIESNSLQYD